MEISDKKLEETFLEMIEGLKAQNSYFIKQFLGAKLYKICNKKDSDNLNKLKDIVSTNCDKISDLIGEIIQAGENYKKNNG